VKSYSGRFTGPLIKKNDAQAIASMSAFLEENIEKISTELGVTLFQTF